MPNTALLVGSTDILDQTLTVNGGPALTLPAGRYYLRHPTPALSLLDTLEATLGLPGGAVRLTRGLRVRIQALPLFEMTLPGRLQRLLGFNAPLTGPEAVYEAALVSPLLWAPGYLATPSTRAGKAGYKVPHTTRHKSDDGSRQETQFFGEEVWQELEWAFVPADLLSLPDEEDDGGTLEGLYEEVLKYGRPLHWYPEVETVADSNPIAWTPSFGPYQLRRELAGGGNWYTRIQSNTDDVGGGVDMDLHLVEEFDA